MAEHNDEPTTPKLSRAEVEQLLERAKAVPSISFGYIRLAQDCLAYISESDERLRTADGNAEKLAAEWASSAIEEEHKQRLAMQQEYLDMLDQAAQKLTAAEAERNLWHNDANFANEQVRSLTAERDELKESLRTTRLEQAAKAFQVDELETKVERLTEEHEKDRQAWMAENTGLLTQVERLTEERDAAIAAASNLARDFVERAQLPATTETSLPS